MGKSIAIFNQKGGVGKTTTNVNLSASIGKLGKKVLVLDMDPQGNTTSGYGIDKNTIENTIYEVIVDGLDIHDAIIKTDFDNIYLVAAASELAGAEIELANEKDREYKLKNSLDKIKDDYDYILIDCPPSLNLITINALTASDDVIVPLQCEFLALEGLADLMKNINAIKRNFNQNLRLLGIVLTMFSKQNNLSKMIEEDVRKYFGAKVFETVIPRSVRVAEAPSHGMPINYYDRTAKGSDAYMDLAAEVIKNNKK